METTPDQRRRTAFLAMFVLVRCDEMRDAVEQRRMDAAEDDEG